MTVRKLRSTPEDHVEEAVAPFAAAVGRLDEIPGLGPIAACAVLAEIGLDMTRFPTAGHLASWAKFAPGIKESAGKKKGRGGTGHGNRYLAKVIGEAAVAAGKTDTFLGERYRRIADRPAARKRPSSPSAAPSWSSIWHLLSDPEARTTTSDPTSTTSGPNPETQEARPHPPTRSPRLQGHLEPVA
jgi:transposase